MDPNFLTALPTDTLMPRRADNLVGSYRRLPIGPGAIGVPAVWDLGAAPHALIAGAAGTGKTMLTNTLVYSAVMRGFRVSVVDLKMGGADHAWAQHVCDAIATDPADAVTAVAQARTGGEDRHLVVLDNFEAITCPADDDAGLWGRLLAAVVDLARVGRSLGVHLVVVAQRADNQAVPAELRDLLGCRILLGAADPLSVALALRDPELYAASAPAAGLGPRCPGRGVVEHGEESMLWMQAYRPGPVTDLRADLE